MIITTREPTTEELAQITEDLAAYNAASNQSLTIQQYYQRIIEDDFIVRKNKKIAAAAAQLEAAVTSLPDAKRLEWTDGAFELYQTIAQS